MELWIRSQDRRKLLKINNIGVAKEYNDEKGYIRTIVAKLTFELGLYSTEERALEVLDEIQSFVDRNKDYPVNAYEMPKE